jgi:hypothetical protein
MPDESGSWSKEIKAKQLYAAKTAGMFKVNSLQPNLKKLIASPSGR